MMPPRAARHTTDWRQRPNLKYGSGLTSIIEAVKQPLYLLYKIRWDAWKCKGSKESAITPAAATFVDARIRKGSSSLCSPLQNMSELVLRRVEHCEQLVGGAGSSPAALELQSRLEELRAHVERAEVDVPDLRACRELLSKMKLDIYRRKTTLASMTDRANELLVARSAIDQAVADLKAIEALSQSSILNHDALHEVPTLALRLDGIDALLRPLVAQAQAQSLQIDAYLDAYEEFVLLMNEFSAKRERQ